MSSTISPNMNLIIPGVGTQEGPEYAENVNSSLTLIDQHNHSPGSGAPITPGGISINTDLTFGNNNATSLRSSRYTPQVSPLALATDLGCVYVSGVDLYYNDSAGNQIRLTQGGSIVGTAGSISGLPSGTASASFAAGTFVWQSATNTPAFMDNASVTIREPVANGFGVTLQTVSSLAGNYTLTLPQIPAGATKIMAMDTSGNITAPYIVDNSTLVINVDTIEVGNFGITAIKLAANSVTSTKIANNAVETAKINDGAVTTPKLDNGAVTPIKMSGISYAEQNFISPITTGGNPSAVITSIGRTMLITVSNLRFTAGGISTDQALSLQVFRGSTPIYTLGVYTGATSSSISSLSFLDTSPGTGSISYTIATTVGTASFSGIGTGIHLYVQEL